jgi:hypothetical protein
LIRESQRCAPELHFSFVNRGGLLLSFSLSC